MRRAIPCNIVDAVINHATIVDEHGIIIIADPAAPPAGLSKAIALPIRHDISGREPEARQNKSPDRPTKGSAPPAGTAPLPPARTHHLPSAVRYTGRRWRHGRGSWMCKRCKGKRDCADEARKDKLPHMQSTPELCYG